MLTKAWHTDTLFLQAHVTGYEESVTISAYQGTLLDAVRMRKRDLTEISKTWAGDIGEVDSNLLKPLADIVRDLNWTGGGELEMIRDANDQLWLLEWNPRFPAWIHGATIAGHNLLACLVAGVTGVKPMDSLMGVSKEFTRVVLEIPVKKSFPLAPLPEPFAGGMGHSMKHPSGLLAFAEKLHARMPINDSQACTGTHLADLSRPTLSDTMEADLNSLTASILNLPTPCYVFMPRTAEYLFGKGAEAAKFASTEQIHIQHAYSIKTNPDERLLRAALDAGFLAEAISPLEVARAIQVGFHPEQIILNGPGKWWRKENLTTQTLKAVFCDSVADLRRVVEAVNAGALSARNVGIRLRTPNISSRFGIPVNTPEVFDRLLEAIQYLPAGIDFGVHFHMASSNMGVNQWMHLFNSMVLWCRSIEKLGGKSISILDIGGGWFPDDWEEGSVERFQSVVGVIANQLPDVRELISEPGKALAQPSMAMATRILEILDHEPGEPTEVVVDASIAELPMCTFYPHRILHMAADGHWQPLGNGNVQLLGRLCMEHDIIASQVHLPQHAKAGDLLVFCDAGGYDKSMSYVFGHGQ